MIKPKLWSGKSLKGVWQVTVKIDGVRALWNGKEWLSRKGKPLYNIPPMPGVTDIEVFCGSFKKTIEATRTKQFRLINQNEMYSLDPLDKRLLVVEKDDPSEVWIRVMLLTTVNMGMEGLVLRQGDQWIKVKPVETIDTTITGLKEGSGRNKGRLGAFLTPLGNVGTGITDKQRIEYWDESLVGETIEVECMQFTPDGKFRHPRFIRLRPDK